jgi:predicted GH43/DUF377 family glycosyl hydrolase
MLYRATNGVKPGHDGTYISSIGHATSADGFHFKRMPEPLIKPDQSYEAFTGCEDPRVTFMDGTYYIYYTAVAKTEDNAPSIRTALATTKDFVHVEKYGIIGPKGGANKASCLLSEKINGQYIMYFTWLSDSTGSTIMAANFNSLQDVLSPPNGMMASVLENYMSHSVVRPEFFNYVFRGPELGAPPLKTNAGWLMIYCGVNRSTKPRWTINALLLDSNDPTKVIARLPEPILSPETQRELAGVENNVTFPSGAIIKDGDLYVYYGSGDQGIMLATCKLKELLAALALNKVSGGSFVAGAE